MTFVIVNLLDDTVILDVAFTTKPSLIHENEGAGFPSASHVTVTFSLLSLSQIGEVLGSQDELQL